MPAAAIDDNGGRSRRRDSAVPLDGNPLLHKHNVQRIVDLVQADQNGLPAQEQMVKLQHCASTNMKKGCLEQRKTSTFRKVQYSGIFAIMLIGINFLSLGLEVSASAKL